ncbi:helicase-primase helicase subunit [Macropodid alphaherpesvirus 2]|uniref:Helicase-primase helicase subunit n=1 Tax=Macropodid alphaherpesvirus 2 TaxID=83440 RepID=A0AAE7MLJ7_9ALPH|nr:helicase-primase helicase subunit [Macropodid alphaherpesvirus 2]QOD40192.1 helicase-primase helicase subunit [Macropodid alphaherpesvirus 2]WGO49712.1 helicase-primase helicase subunit [Macropodid alphaherpesvirus 2]
MAHVEVAVLYATDGCVITSSLALLTNCMLGAEPLYILSYDAWIRSPPYASGSCLPAQEMFARDLSIYHPEGGLFGDSFKVTFYLLGATQGPDVRSCHRERIRPMFVCNFTEPDTIPILQHALSSGTPISPQHILKTLDTEATFQIQNPMILALNVAIAKNAAPGGLTPGVWNNPKEALRSTIGHMSTGQRGLSTLFIHHESRVLAAYRRAYYGSAQSPFWFLSKFGPDEKSLVLTTKYYLLQARRLGGAGATYDLQSIKDICSTYAVRHPPRSDTISAASLTSFAELTKFCATSLYNKGPTAVGFPFYVAYRIAVDVKETGALKNFITHDRSSLRVSDRDFITYIYLAYFECFNPTRLARHLKAVTTTTPTPTPITHQVSSLGGEVIDQFFTHVRAHLNINEYIQQNVTPRETVLHNQIAQTYLRARTYAPSTFTGNPPRLGGWVATATQMVQRLNETEALLGFRGWPTTVRQIAKDGENGGCLAGGGIVKRLLQLAATEQQPGLPPAISALVEDSTVCTPIPAYRISMLPKGQAFAVLSQDHWAQIIGGVQLSDCELTRAFKTTTNLHDLGLVLTQSVQTKHTLTYKPVMTTPHNQSYVNRNEIFNSSLVITNIILDLDIALKAPIPFEKLYSALHFFRRSTITAIQLLFPNAEVNADTFPCYFFKSTCPPLAGTSNYIVDDYNDCAEHYNSATPVDMDVDSSPPDDEELEYFDLLYTEPTSKGPDTTRVLTQSDIPICTCKQKIGLRVCLPVPKPYVLAGSQTVRGVARVIQQAVLLDRDFMETVGDFVKNFLLIDTGVYTQGHSLRLPYFSKITETGGICGRLLPVFIIPPSEPDTIAFIQGHYDPQNFHFHAPRQAKGTSPQAVHVIHSLGGDYISFFERKASHNALKHFGRKETLAEVLTKYDVQVNAIGNIETFAANLLDRVVECLEVHFPEYIHEYRSISVQQATIKDDRALLQLVPARGTYPQTLSCLRFKHKRSSRTTARTFLALGVGQNNTLCVSLCQQCFATKCDNNRLHTLFTINLGAACS